MNSKVLVNWFVSEKLVRVGFKFPKRYDKRSDFAVLCRVPGGELGFDREEGFKFEIDPTHLPELAAKVREAHRAVGFPLVYENNVAVTASMNIGPGIPDYSAAFIAAGFVRGQPRWVGDSGDWELR